MHPFVKWVGGKTQLLDRLLPLFPACVPRYFEPFVGGGAVFWALASEKSPRYTDATLCDSNEELISLYQVVQASVQPLMHTLRALEEEYEQAPYETYMRWRENVPSDPIQRAARFILLNKAGFNGIYRVNKQGKFNVPWGKRPRVVLFDEENLLACSQALGPVHLHRGDFAAVLDWAKEGDLVYFDPPYTPVSMTANFTSYTADGFGPRDHQRLAAVFRELHQRGCHVFLSNSDTLETRELYAEFEIVSVQAKRHVNSRGDKRGPVGEIIVCS